MPFDLNRFRNTLIKGGARPSQFEMSITWPINIPSGIAAGIDFRFLCQISQIPASTIGTVQVPYFGRKIKLAGDREFEPLTLTVLNDEDYKIRHALEDWMRAITGHETTVSQFGGGIATDTASAISYATEGVVTQLSRNERGNGSTQSYRFVGMYPVNLSAIDLNWNSTDEIETFTCQFNYQWWEPVQAFGLTAVI